VSTVRTRKVAVRGPLALLVIVTLFASTACGSFGGAAGTKFSAMLTTAIGVYPGADVRVLGVPVGKVDTVTPQGDLVRVDFHVDSGTDVPADAKVAVVAPTVVADRYLQLSPIYTTGPKMPEGTVIPKERTASPPEFDDLLASAKKLSAALGPQGVNSDGALSQALTTAARNLKGNGKQLNTTLDNTSQAITTLSANRDNLEGTTTNLQSFTSNLKDDDKQIRDFTNQFAQVNGFLVDERQNLGDTLKELSKALGDVAKFVHDNRKEIRDNVDQLSDVLQTINDERLALEQVLETAPAGLDGLVNAYNASTGTLDTRANLLASLLCSLVAALPAPLGGATGILTPILVTIVPGGLPGCSAAPTTMAAAGSLPLKLSPSTLAQLKDPAVMTKLIQLAQQNGSARSSAPAAAPRAVPQAGLPAVGPLVSGPAGRSDSRPPDTDREDRPPTLGGLLGGGR
jgi:phospholipid/cholesterol/gamma-HCH transport system substrate-binding protein